MNATNPNANTHTQLQSPVAERLRTALHAARGNQRIRERLREIAADPARLEPIVRELGPRHALVRDLLEMAKAA